MNACPQCGAEVPPSGGRRPRRFCSDRCRVLCSEERRAIRGEIAGQAAERARLADAMDAGRWYDGRAATPELVSRVDQRIGELEARLAGLESGPVNSR